MLEAYQQRGFAAEEGDRAAFTALLGHAPEAMPTWCGKRCRSEPDSGTAQAARLPVATVRHGRTFSDDYGWLQKRGNPAVLEYLEAENHYTAALTADLQPQAEKIYQEMLGRIQQTDLSVPVRRGEYFYYSRTVEGLQYPIHCRKRGSVEGEEQVLLDLNQLAVGLEFLSLGSFDVSDDARLLAYTTDNTGMRRYTLHLKNLETGATEAGLAERVTSVEWSGR